MNHDREEQFQQLLPYYGRVVLFFKQLGFEHEEAKDLAQDVFVRVIQSKEHYRGEAKWSYLQTIARRTASNEVRRRKANRRAGTHVSMDTIDGKPDERIVPADEEVGRKEKKERLRLAIEKLDGKSQTLMGMYLAGDSYREMEQVLGMTENGLKTALRDLRTRLRDLVGEEWEDFGGTHDQ
jgi:RNA polymerase sigma factor (sigma-70 family)